MSLFSSCNRSNRSNRSNQLLMTAISCVMCCVLLLAAASSNAAPTQSQGGVINVATIGEPPTLDPMVSTADLVGIITQHMFETLYTFGVGWKIIPLLADAMPTVSADGKTVTIPIRKGVKFHDGASMTANDVVASLKRWMTVAVRGKLAAEKIESITAPNATTVVIKMHEYYAPLFSMLAFNNSAAVIMPEKQLKPALTEFIGTGPYQFKERQPDRFIVLSRFANYSARSDAADLFGGKRTAYLDQIRFVPVPNANTRVEGATSGQFSFVDAIPVEAFSRFDGNLKTEAVITKPFGAPLMFFNTKQGALANPALRRAVQMSLNTSDMLEAAFGKKAFYDVNGAFYPIGFPFSTKVGSEPYNQANTAKAKAMAKAVGYNGQTIKILASNQYDFHLKMAQVAAEYMKMAGFKVDLQISDWATLTTRRNDPKAWAIYFTHSPFLAEPSLNSMMNNNAPGWWATERKNTLLTAFNSEPDQAKRVAIFGDIQKLIYEEVPVIKVGDFNVVTAKAKNLIGYTPSPWPYFWNVSLQK